MTATAEPHALVECPVLIAVVPPLPIESLRIVVREPAGDWTVQDVVDATGLQPDGLAVSLDGVLVPRAEWPRTVPTAGQSLIVSTRPGVEAIFAFFAASFGAGTIATAAAVIATAVVVVGVSFGLSALANALLAPSKPNTDTTAPGVRRTISGSANTFEPYAPVPQVLGKHRMFPPLAARSYTTVENGKLFQYSLFTFGYGPLALSELKIGEDPLFRASTSPVYTGVMKADADKFILKRGEDGLVEKSSVELELRAGTGSDAAITLFARDVQELIIGQRLRRRQEGKDDPITRRTAARATRITVIVACPSGLIYRTERGGTKERQVAVRVEYRSATSTGAWTEVTERVKETVVTEIPGPLPRRTVTTTKWHDRPIQMQDATLSTVFASRSWDVTEGTYDVRLTLLTLESDAPGIIEITEWTSMLVHRAGDVVNEDGLCLVAMRAQITDEFVRVIDQFNAIAWSQVLDWNGATWAVASTSNPASLFRHVLQGSANRRAVADSKLNLTALQAWHVACAAKSFEFNTITQGRVTVIDMLRQVAAAGRASPAIQDGLFSVVVENVLSGAPIQHFSPRNVVSFEEVRSYVTPPHAFKVQFVDPQSGYLDTERIVPDDGYTADTATVLERLDIPGITSSDQAYKLGRYHLAVLRLRPSEFVIETDFEHLDCVRGDWVKFNHDVILTGLAAGRVVSVTLNGGGDCTGVVVDQECPMTSSTYGIRFRKSSDGSTIVKVVTTAAGYQTTLTFSSVIASGNPMPVAGDLFLFGLSGSESIDCIVKSIEPTGDLGARLTLVDAAPGVLTADSGTIPKYDPQITLGPGLNPLPLPKTRVLLVSSHNVKTITGSGTTTKTGLRIQIQPPGVTTK